MLHNMRVGLRDTEFGMRCGIFSKISGIEVAFAD
jgi:hypothetical protein